MELVEVVKSKYGFDETVEALKKASEENGWNVANKLDMRESPLGKEIVIIEICKRDVASQVLSREENFWVSAMMPCRISVCKQRDGVYVYRMNTKAFSNMVRGEMAEIFKGIAEEEEKIVKSVIG